MIESGAVLFEEHGFRALATCPKGAGLGQPMTCQMESKMLGTPSQIEWAEQIKPRVQAEFDRVAAAFRAASGRQAEQDRTDTEALLAILEEKRVEVMANNQAGYFIRQWQELSDQVRQMIGQDSRYQAIQSNRAARRRCTVNASSATPIPKNEETING